MAQADLKPAPASPFQGAAWILPLLLTMAIVSLMLVDCRDWSASALFLRNFPLLLLACAIPLCAEPLQHRLAASRMSAWRPLGTMLLLATALAVGITVEVVGMRQFAGYDQGIMIEAGWRQLQGQRPCTDFPCTLPPAFIWGIKYAFLAFGTSWRSVLVFSGIASAAAVVWAYLLARTVFQDRAWAAWTTAATIASTMLLTMYWWYNELGSLTCVLVILSSLAVCRQPQRWAIASLGISLGALVLMKPNFWPAAAGIGPLLVVRARLRPFLIAVLIAAAMVLGLSWINHYDLIAMLRTYMGLVASRGNPLSSPAFDDLGLAQQVLTRVCESLFAVIYSLALVRVLLDRAHGTEKRTPLELETLYCGAVALLVGAYCVQTNMELKLSDLLPMCLGAALPVALLGDRIPGAVRSLAVTALAYMTVASLFSGFSRERVYAAGSATFYQTTSVPLTGQPFFDGLRAGPWFQRVSDQLRKAVQHNAGRKIFFGPRLDFGYAAFGLPSPVGFPLWWRDGAGYPHDRQEELISSWRQQHFDVLLLYGNDRTFMPWIDQELASFQRDDHSYEGICVYTRLPPPAAGQTQR